MWDALKQSRKPIVLYGMGNGADKILAELERRGIKVSGVFASDGFARRCDFHGFTVVPYSEAKARFGDMAVLLAFGSQRPEVMELIRRVDAEQELYAPHVPVIGDVIFDEEFADKNSSRLSAVRNILSDGQSRRVFDGIVNYRLSGKLSYLTDIETSPDEAYENVLRLDESEDFLDLGAYRGDTVKEFTSHVGAYSSIRAVEPDSYTFKRLEKAIEALQNCACFNVGIGAEQGKMRFSSRKGRSSSADELGDYIACESVDSLAAGARISFINMDVEGREAEAISGARSTLEAFKPKILMAAYHRSEDIFDLPERVLSLRPDYKVYMRHYPYFPDWDTNFYFV